MVAKRRKQTRGLFERSPLDLIEEAVHLLRMAPLSVLAVYYVGSAPFVLAFLFFWADMTRSAFASQRLVPASLGLAALYLWMKFWHAVYAETLRLRLSRSAPAKWTIRRVCRIFMVQAIIQSSCLFVLPLAASFTIPLGWVLAFYHNASLTVRGNRFGSGNTCRGRGNRRCCGRSRTTC